jgi:hypothetical protein
LYGEIYAKPSRFSRTCIGQDYDFVVICKSLGMVQAADGNSAAQIKPLNHDGQSLYLP